MSSTPNREVITISSDDELDEDVPIVTTAVVGQKRERESTLDVDEEDQPPVAMHLLEERLALAHAKCDNSHSEVDLNLLYLPKPNTQEAKRQSATHYVSNALVQSVSGFALEADALTAKTESGLLGQIQQQRLDRMRRQLLRPSTDFQLATNIATTNAGGTLSNAGNIFATGTLAAPALFASDGSLLPSAAAGGNNAEYNSILQRRSFNISSTGGANPFIIADGGNRSSTNTNLRELLNGQRKPLILSQNVQAAAKRLHEKGVKWLRHVDGRIADRRSVFEASAAYHPNLTQRDVNDFVLMVGNMPDIAQGLPITSGMTETAKAAYLGGSEEGRNPFGLGSGFVPTFGEAAHPGMYAYVFVQETQRNTDVQDGSSPFTPGRRLGGQAQRLLPANEGYDDNGEAGSGTRILGVCKRMTLEGWVVVVARWYGGILLGPARFSHITNVTSACVRAAKTQMGV